jgi:hypothetical protein
MRTLTARACGCLALLSAASSWAQTAPSANINPRVTVVVPFAELPSSNEQWAKSSSFAELKKRGAALPETSRKAFTIGATYPKGQPFSVGKFPAKMSNPFAADMPPSTDPTCHRTDCTETCTTDKDGVQHCTTHCNYQCDK